MNIPTRKFMAALSLFATLGLAGTTNAQTKGPAIEKVETLEKFTVTGSFLPVSAAVTANPVVTLESAEIGMSGSTDALQLLKQLTPYFAGNGNIGTDTNNGGGGESKVALRNLRTLVLLNGQRMATSPFSNTNGGDPGVDLNLIPTAMIERIEILKDGASTVYGSDAIGGVVNVILKKNYNGFESGVRYSSTRNGDYKSRSAYIMGGVSQPGVSLTIGAQHFENTPLITTARPLTTMTPVEINNLGYNVTSAVFSGTYAGRVGNDILAGSPLAAGAPGFKSSVTTPPAKTSPTAAPQTLAQLEAAGIYIPIASTPTFAAVGSTSLLNTTLFGNSLIVSTKRNEFVANGSKELLGKNLEVFGDFLYAQTTNTGSVLAPTPISGVGAGGANSLVIPANNPYNLFGIIIGIGQPAGAPAVRTRTEELGKRTNNFENNVFRFVGGLKGDFTDQYSWEASYNYSRASLTQNVVGGANGANMNQLMTPLIQGGNYVYNAAGRPLSVLQNAAGNNLPVYNIFALPGFNDPDTLNAIRANLFKYQSSTLRTIDLRLKGKVFPLPAGDLSFAAGVSTGVEELTSAVDGLFANGLALGFNPAATFGGGTRRTEGGFIEVGVPVTSPKMSVPGFHAVDLNLADRVERIKPGGNATTPKVGVRWLPFNDNFVIRGTYAKGFIAPSIFNLFGPSAGNSPTFTTWQGDGRSGSGGSSTRTIVVQGNSNELSNPTLLASKSKSYTVGFVFAPKQVKGLSVTVDYYSIKQDKVGSIDYTAAVADLNAKGAGSYFAQDPLKLGAGFVFADGTRLTTNTANQVNHTNFGTLSIVRDPAGDQKTNGLDLAVDYRFKTDNAGDFGVGASANILFDYKFRATSSDPYYQFARVMTDSTIGGAGANGLLPGYIVKPYINYSYKGLTGSVFMNYIPKVTVPGTLFAGAKATNDYTLNGKASKTPSYFTTDMTVSYTLPNFGKNWLRNTTLLAGANNVFNKKAPYVPGNGNNAAENNTVKSTYDIIGRFMFVELKKRF